MFFDDPLNNRQSNPCPLEFLRTVQALEYTKQTIVISHIKPDAVIADKIDNLLVQLAPANFNFGMNSFLGKFKRIRKKVE